MKSVYAIIVPYNNNKDFPKKMLDNRYFTISDAMSDIRDFGIVPKSYTASDYTKEFWIVELSGMKNDMVKQVFNYDYEFTIN